MSLEPPSKSSHLKVIHTKIDTFQQEVIASPLNPKTLNKLIATIKELHTLAENCLASKEVDVLLLNREIHAKVNLLAFNAFRNGEKEQSNTIRSAAADLFAGSDYLACVVSNWSRVEKEGLIPFIGEKWAYSELLFWVEKKDPWALDQLEQLIDQQHPTAYKILWIIAGKEQKYFEQIHNPKINQDALFSSLKEVLEENLILNPNEDTEKSILETLDCFTQQVESNELFAILWDFLDPDSIKSTIIDFLMLFLKSENSYPILFEFFLDKLKLQEEGAIQLLKIWIWEYNSNFKEFQEKAFWTFLLQKCYVDVEVQLILVASMQIEPSCIVYQRAIEKVIRNHPGEKNTLSYLLFPKLNSFVKKFTKQLKDLELKYPEKFSWIHASPTFRHVLAYAYLKRIQTIIYFFLNKGEALPLDYPISDSFVRPKFALVGATSSNLDVFQFLNHKFTEIGIPVMAVSVKGALPELDIELLDGQNSPWLWIRDTFSIHQNSVRSPAPIILDKEVKLNAFEERLLRMQDEEGEGFDKWGPAVCEAVAVNQEQLCFFEYCKTLYTQRKLPAKNRVMQSLFYEGGNVLRGEDYVLFGRDTLGLNRIPLQRLLAQLGLSKKEGGKWSLGPSYPVTEAKFRVEDQDMIGLLAQDWGVSEDKVFPVEQADYHLDVFMALIDAEEKRVLVSDSLESARILKDYYENEIKEGRIDETKVKDLRKKIEEFTIEAVERSYFENKAKKDLQDSHFTAISVPGIFEELATESPQAHRVNFFNYISCRDGEDRKYIFALGVPDFLKELCETTFKTHIPDLHDLDFAPIQGSQYHLSNGGGLHCITQLVY